MPIEATEVLSPEEYGRERESQNRAVIGVEKRRRVSTKTFTFLFENRDTVINQINEMIFIENIKDPEEVRYLINVYNDLMPSGDTLSVSMFIEISDPDVLLREMPRLSGIENTVYLQFDGNEVKAIPEEGRSTETLESTLQYLKFRFTAEDATRFRSARNVFLETRHQNYSEAVRIPDSLKEDLSSEITV